MSRDTVALFPGQGVQRPGMADGYRDAAPQVFEAASHALGIDLAELCATGRTGDADLTSTRWAQPAVVAVGVAGFLGLDGSGWDALCGHSLGEYTALVCAGAMSVEDAVRLVELRGRVMEEAAAANPGGMAAVLRLEPDEVEAIAAEVGLSLAGDNAPGQTVVSGPHAALERARVLVEDRGGKWAGIDVAGAFHSPAMETAVGLLDDALAGTRIRTPEVEVWSPTTTRPVTGPDGIRDALVRQLTSPVRFRETIEALGPRTAVDVGPGRVVGGMVRRIIPDADVRFAADLVGAV